MTNRADISIRVRGSSAATMERRAVALERLAASTLALSRAARRLPAVSASASTYATNITKARGRTDAFGTSLTRTGNALDNFGTLFLRMIRIMTAFAIITVVTSAFREFVGILGEAPAKMELWSTQLTTLIGSATVAADKLELLKTVAIETPLELPDLFQGLTTLRAFNVEMSERTLPLLSDLAAVSGRSFQEIAEVAGKVIQGSPTAITRSLPTVGINPQVFKQRAAKVGSRAEALFTIIEERFKDFAKRSAQTTIGLISNIKDAIFVIAADVGEGLLQVFRPQIQEIFDTLDEIRRDPELLRELSNTVAGLANNVVALGRAAVIGVSGLQKLVEALGGMRVVLTSIAVLLTGKIALALARFVAGMNPITIVLSGIVILVSQFATKMSESSRAINAAREEQMRFGDELARTNRLARENISLVDANVATRQANRLNEIASRGAGIVGSDAGPGQLQRFLEEAQRVAGGEDFGPSGARINAAVADFNRLFVGPTPPMESLRAIISQDVIPVLNELSEEFFATARSARKMAEDVVNAGSDVGEVITTEIADEIKRPFKAFDLSFEGFRKIGEMMRKEVLEGFNTRLDEIKLRLELGRLSESEALRVLSEFRDQIKELIQRVLDAGGPIQFVIALQAVVKNIDAVIEGLKEDIKNPVSDALETALRQAVAQASGAVADVFAHLITPQDGAKIESILKTALSGVLNALGDALIQAGIAAKIFQDLFANILSPTAAIAAIGAGIALKAIAGALANSVANQGSASRSSTPPSREPIRFPTVAGSPNQEINVQIQAIDSQSVEQFVNSNPASFAGAIIHVAREDQATDGSAFGVFQPVRA